MHAGTLSDNAQNALAILGKSGFLKECHLAGGSALALHLGHRKSYDFDFYTRKKLLVEDIAFQLKKLGDFHTTLLEPPHTLLGEFQKVKFSLFRYDYPLIGPVSILKDISIASIQDIAAMKLSAITGRATKRDYIDLYFISKTYTIDQILDFYDKKFGNLGNNIYPIIKALGFFEDAEADQMPQMIKEVSWEKVKGFFLAETLHLTKKYLRIPIRYR